MPAEWDQLDDDRSMVEGECQCCMLVRPIQRKGKGDQQLCDSCRLHVGDRHRDRRERSHRQLWRDERLGTTRQLERIRAIARADRDQLQGQLGVLTAERDALQATLLKDYEGRPPELVLNQIQMAEINKEREKLTAMRGFVTHLFRALLTIDQDHRLKDDDPDTCICGRAASSCNACAGIGQVAKKLYKWEDEQIDRGRDGQPNELPRWHPDANAHFNLFQRGGTNHPAR